MSRSEKQERKTIVLLSGSTGRTVDEVVRAALAQFDNAPVRIVRRNHVRTVRGALKAVAEAAAAEGLLFHSLVVPKVREAVIRKAQTESVPTVDVLGPALSALNDFLGCAPRLRPGLSYQLQKEHFDRIDAVNFTVRHDDGCMMEDLKEADAILVGPSRSAKSATCFYLAYHGIRAANVPVVPGWEVPVELRQADKGKVIALTMGATRLQSIRRERVRAMERAGAFDKYTEMRAIREELREIDRLAVRYGWQRIDVSYMSVEEVARHVIAMIGS
jgi:[pyruvate, water dikinase]-phosphate phosphotransferase / [pyruvate, water dikinase] kinase